MPVRFVVRAFLYCRVAQLVERCGLLRGNRNTL